MLKLRLRDKIRYKIDSIKTTLYLKYMESKGYILKDCTPIKCPYCKSSVLEDCNVNSMGHIILEYDTRCGECGKILGHCNYGHWDLW